MDATQRQPLTGKGRQPSVEMDAEQVVALLDALELRGIGVWVHGGWGVDALIGRQRRRHDDLDCILERRDCARAIDVLGKLGYAVSEGTPPRNFVFLDGVGHQVDVHPVEFAPNGDGVYLMATGEAWPFPADGFAGRGEIGGRKVRCLTPEVEVLCHADYELDDEDYADLDALHEQFGVVISSRR